MSSFSQRFGKGLVSGMEDDTVVETPVDDSVYVEHAEATADVEGGLADISSAIEDTEALSALTDKAQELQERDGGLDQTATEILDIAVEAIYARLGISRKPGLAMESIADEKGKRDVSVALESFGETLAKIWQAIKDAFKKMVEWVKSFFTSSEKTLKQQDEEIKAVVAKGKKGKNAGTESIALEDAEGNPTLSLSARKYLSNWEQNPSADEIFKCASKALNFFHTAFTAGMLGGGEDFSDGFEKLIKDTPDSKEEAYKLFTVKSFGKDCLNKFGGKFVDITDDDQFGLFALDLGIANAHIAYKLPSPEITDGRVFSLLTKVKCSVDILSEEDRNILTDKPNGLKIKQVSELSILFAADTDKTARSGRECANNIEEAIKDLGNEMKRIESDPEAFKAAKNPTIATAVVTELMRGSYACAQQSQSLLVKLQSIHIKVRAAILEYCKYSMRLEREIE